MIIFNYGTDSYCLFPGPMKNQSANVIYFNSIMYKEALNLGENRGVRVAGAFQRRKGRKRQKEGAKVLLITPLGVVDCVEYPCFKLQTIPIVMTVRIFLSSMFV